MTEAVFWRIVWKEYRTQRGLWLAVLGMAIFAQLVVLLNIRSNDYRASVVLMIAYLASSAYAAGCGAVLFAGECEEGTADLLRSLSLSAVELLTSKLSFAFLSTVLMLGLLLLFGGALCVVPAASRGFTLGDRELFLAIFALYLLAWGTLFSLLTRKVLHAVILVPAGALAVPPFGGTVGLLAALVVVLTVDLWLARRWLTGRRVAWLDLSALKRPKENAAKLDVVKETSPSRRQTLGRLLWQEWRHARGFFAVYCGVAVCLLIFSTITSHSLRFDFAFLVIPSAPLLMGVWTFRAEQAGRRFRFPAERGISPYGFWLSKQTIWLPLAAIASLLFLAVDSAAETFWALKGEYTLTGIEQHVFWHRIRLMLENMLNPGLYEVLVPWYPTPERNWTGLVLLFISLGYAAGQFVSLLIPRAVTATFVGSLLAAALWGWLYLMDRLQVPLWWSVAPLVLILLAATLARTRDWMLERPGWRPWLRVGAICLLPTALLVTAVACYRVFEIPAVSPGFSVGPYLAPITPEESRTADMYRQAALQLPPPPRGGSMDGKYQMSLPKSAQDGWEYVTKEERHWLEENQDVLRIVLATTRRENCVLFDSSRPDAWDCSGEEFLRTERLRKLLLFSAWKLESEGQWDEALERHLATVRLAKRVAARANLSRWADSRWLLHSALREIFAWAGKTEQSPKQLRAAIREIERATASLPLRSEALKNEYALLRHRFIEDADTFLGQVTDDFSSIPVVLSVFRQCFPWEEARTLRLADALTADQLRTTKETEAYLMRPGSDLSALKASSETPSARAREIRLKAALQRWVQSTPLMMGEWGVWCDAPYPMADLEARRRGLLLTLALSAWRKEHGKLPSRLDALIGPYFDELPLDPWSGHEFGYCPEGIPAPVDSCGWHYPGPAPMEPGQPFLWSVGRDNQRIVVAPDRDKNRPACSIIDQNGQKTPTGADGALYLQLAFPIP